MFAIEDILAVSYAQILTIFAIVASNYSLFHGKAGTVESVMNIKIIVTTILSAFYQELAPTPIEIAGLGFGFAGIILIVW